MEFEVNTTFSAKFTTSFGIERAAPGLIWPKWHVEMVADCCRSIPKSNLVHDKVLRGLGWELYMIVFYSNTPFSAKPTLKFGQKRTV